MYVYVCIFCGNRVNLSKSKKVEYCKCECLKSEGYWTDESQFKLLFRNKKISNILR